MGLSSPMYYPAVNLTRTLSAVTRGFCFFLFNPCNLFNLFNSFLLRAVGRAMLASLLIFLTPSPATANLVLQIGQNFTASTFRIDSDATPPDAALAVSSNHVVEFINGRYSVYCKTNADLLQSMTDLSFWTNAGVIFDPDLEVSDPRLIFDPGTQRWFASMIDFSQSSTSNRFLVGVSATADPTGAWDALAVP